MYKRYETDCKIFKAEICDLLSGQATFAINSIEADAEVPNEINAEEEEENVEACLPSHRQRKIFINGVEFKTYRDMANN